MTFVYDTRKVPFQNIIGEIVLPRTILIAHDRQFERTPFMVNFQSGWLKFSLCTVHLYYGSTSGEGYERRLFEIEEIGTFLAKRAKREKSSMILLGDMNIFAPNDKTMEALKKSGFFVPDGLVLPTQYATHSVRYKARHATLFVGHD